MAGAAPTPAAPAKSMGVAEPNKTLFVENLPGEATDTMLSMLFRRAGTPPLSILDFDAEDSAAELQANRRTPPRP